MLSLASGKPPESFGWLVQQVRQKKRHPANQPMTDAEYDETKAQLVGELPGIRNWLLDGRRQALGDPKFLDDLRLIETNRN
jgi:hypothetical protein